jgi:chaperonin GroES
MNSYIKQNKMSVSIKPLSDRVVIEEIPADSATASGIILPDSAQEKPLRGVVVGVGDGRSGEPMTVKVGDTVLYGKHSGTQITLGGKNYLIMHEYEIFAVV